MGGNVLAGELNLDAYFGDYTGAMVILDAGTGKTVQFHPEGCALRVPPCSTFKIPNAVFGLDSGVLSGPDHLIPWDGVKRSYEVWNQDLTLHEAIRYSAVPYFQVVARQIGSERMQAYVTKTQYGNMDITGGIDTFWLGSSLMISPDEQVIFLQRLFGHEFDLSKKAVNTVSRLIWQKDTPRGRLHGKTGSHKDKLEGWDLGWFAGYVDTDDTRYYFAANITGGDKPRGTEARKIAETVLHDLGFLGEPESVPVLDTGFEPLKSGMYLVHEKRQKDVRYATLPEKTRLAIYDQGAVLGLENDPVQYIVVSATPDVPIILGCDPKKDKDARGHTKLNLQLEENYAPVLESFTRKNVGASVAMIIGGRIITMHKIRTAIEGGRMQITRCTDNACDTIYSTLISERKSRVSEP